MPNIPSKSRSLADENKKSFFSGIEMIRNNRININVQLSFLILIETFVTPDHQSEISTLLLIDCLPHSQYPIVFVIPHIL